MSQKSAHAPRHDIFLDTAREQRLVALDIACQAAGAYYPYRSFTETEPGVYQLDTDAGLIIVTPEEAVAINGLFFEEAA